MTRRVGGRVQVNNTISVTILYLADPVVSSDIFTFQVSTKLFYVAIHNAKSTQDCTIYMYM